MHGEHARAARDREAVGGFVGPRERRERAVADRGVGACLLEDRALLLAKPRSTVRMVSDGDGGR